MKGRGERGERETEEKELWKKGRKTDLWPPWPFLVLFFPTVTHFILRKYKIWRAHWICRILLKKIICKVKHRPRVGFWLVLSIPIEVMMRLSPSWALGATISDLPRTKENNGSSGVAIRIKYLWDSDKKVEYTEGPPLKGLQLPQDACEQDGVRMTGDGRRKPKLAGFRSIKKPPVNLSLTFHRWFLQNNFKESKLRYWIMW